MSQCEYIEYTSIGRRIRQCRQALGMTQNQLAKLIGVTGSFVGHIERAEKVPSLETVARLSAELGVTMDWLVFGIKQRCDAEPCALYADLDAIMKTYGFRERGDEGSINTDLSGRRGNREQGTGMAATANLSIPCEL